MSPCYDLITLREPSSKVADAYRGLAANLFHTAQRKTPKTLLVTSSGLEDESDNLQHLSKETLDCVKSIVLANLAVVLAQGSHKTLIVDCDFRHPSQHEIWLQPNNTGILSFIFGQSDLPSCATTVNNLSIVPSGTPRSNPGVLLDSPRMDAVLAVLAQRAEIILFDSSPLTCAVEPLFLASKTDGVLLVINASTTRTQDVQHAKRLLRQRKASVLGAVLVNAPEKTPFTMRSQPWEASQ